MNNYNDLLHVSYEELTVYLDDKPQFILNKRLLDSQLAWSNLNAIKEAYILKLLIYDMIVIEDDSKMLKSLAMDLTEIEYELQDLWYFSRDQNFHRFWETPKCLCAKLDNEDRYPTGYYSINLSCPLHGV